MRRNNHAIQRQDTERAKKLRQKQTPAEKVLWDCLRESSKLRGVRFRRQQPIHPYIIDFACMKANLLVEIDGDSHDMQQAYDQERTRYLEKSGYKVLRFTNQDIHTNLEGVVRSIFIEAGL